MDLAFWPTDHKRLSNDYENSGIFFMDDSKNFTVDPEKTFTHDLQQAKWDYFREDPLFHVFHTLVHQVTKLSPPIRQIIVFWFIIYQPYFAF